MTRLPFNSPGGPRSCPKCEYTEYMYVRYVCPMLAFDGTPIDEWLELTCRRCGYVSEMECAV